MAHTASSSGTKITGTIGLSGLEYFGPQDYRQLLRRSKWLMVTATLVVALMIAIGAYLFPNLYLATTVIVVDPEKVPEGLVKSTATIDATQRLAMLQEQILSTTRLGQVIDELGLYKHLKQTKTQDEIVTQMRKDIKVEPATTGITTKELQAFKVSFTSRNSALAAQVANRLASLFIEENMKVREQQVLGTADFFDRELEKAKKDLDEKAQNLAELRSHYVAELPESQNLHLQALTNTQLEMRAEMDEISRDQQQKTYLQSLLSDNPLVVNLDNEGASANTIGLTEQLQHLQAEMDQSRTRYGPNYPDVLNLAAEINSLQQQIKDEDKANAPTRSSTAAGRRSNPVVESQLSQLDDDIGKHEARLKDIKSRLAYYQQALEGAPQAEQQLTTASNDYSNAEDRYKRLEEHKFAADMSSDVETRQKGERFVILEPAQPPEHPYAPNRVLIDVLGLVVGVGTGLFLIFVKEMVDATVKTKRELADRLKAPVFGEMPWLATKSGKKRTLLRIAFALTGNLALVAGYAALFWTALRQG
jgi:polysaccharide chain length determinant protein (PEP-CTERM system associated)